jgi:hypothetical protein
MFSSLRHPIGWIVSAMGSRHRKDSLGAGPRPVGLPTRSSHALYHRRRNGARADGTKDEKRLLRYQKQMASYELLIVDELGFVP